MTRAAIIIAFEGYRDEELRIPFQAFLNSNFTMDVYSDQTGVAKGKLGDTFLVVNNINDILVDKYDVIIFIGGPGGYGYLGNETIVSIVNETHQKGILWRHPNRWINRYFQSLCNHAWLFF